jgi:hypothetical protein
MDHRKEFSRVSVHPQHLPRGISSRPTLRSSSASSTFARLLSLKNGGQKSADLDVIVQQSHGHTVDHPCRPNGQQDTRQRVGLHDYDGELGPVVDIQRQTPVSKRVHAKATKG